MRDGVTPLSEDFFNPVFADIDTRIADLEERRADLQGVVDELTLFGLARIDTLVGPAMAEVNAMLALLRQRRDELEAAIGNVGDLATKTQLDALAAEHEAVAQALALRIDVADAAALGLAQTKVDTVNGQAGPAVTLKPSHLALGPANGASLVELTRDGNGRLTQVARQVSGKAAVQTLAYDGQGRLSTVTTVYDGRTRTETITYDAAGLQKVTAVEVQA